MFAQKKNQAPHFHRLSMAEEAILLWDHDGPAAIDWYNNKRNGKGQHQVSAKPWVKNHN